MKNAITSKDIENIYRLIRLLNIQYKYFIKEKRRKKRYMMGALLIYKNKFSVGFNNYNKTHTNTIQLNNYTIPLHAEIEAINKWNHNWNIKKSTIYVTGLNRGGNFCISAKPCVSCMEKINQVGIQKIVYTSFLNGEFKVESIYNNK